MVGTGVACCILSQTSAVAQTSPPRTVSAVLTNISQIRQLTREQEDLNLPVSLEGVVTVRVASNRAFVQDDTGGILVYCSPTGITPVPGLAVKVTGQVRSGQYAPTITHGVLSESAPARPLPPAPLLGYWDMLEDQNHARWIQTTGVIRCVPPSRSPGTYLEAVAGQHRFLIIMTGVGSTPIPSRFFGATVRLRGVCASLFNGEHQIRGAKLYVQDYSDITVLDAAPPTPELVPYCTVGSLASFTPSSLYVHSLRLEGTVTHDIPGPNHLLFIEDETGAIKVQLQNDQPSLPVGSRVQVIGYPEAGLVSTFLNDATVRLLQNGRPGQPHEVRLAELLTSRRDAQLVRFRGRLVNQVLKQNETILFVRGGDVVVGAHLTANQIPKSLSAIVPDSLLELTGIWQASSGDQLHPQNFELTLRSLKDVQVVAPPPWWNLRHTLILLSGLAVAALAALAWLAILRRQARRQTATVRAQVQREAALEQQCRDLYETTSDIIFDQDQAGRLLSVNPALERVTGLDATEASQTLVAELSEAAAKMRSNEEPGPPAARPFTEGLELELRAKDGRRVVLDVHSHQVQHPGKKDRILGIARDVTRRKMAEEKLRQAKQELEATNQRLVARNQELQVANQSLEAEISERFRAMQQIEQLRRQLRESSRQAGKAEMATEVLHNVGNFLNSVNVSATLMQSRVRKSRSASLARVAAMLQERHDDVAAFLAHDEKGRQLPDYLEKLAGYLAHERAALLTEAEGLTNNIAHIRDIISLQQRYAHMSTTTDTFKLPDLIEDALRIQSGSWSNTQIQLVRDYQDSAPVQQNRHQVLQILVNLLQNARMTCEESNQPTKQITIRVTQTGKDHVVVEITDNGPGLTREEIESMFNPAVASRKNGHTSSLPTAAYLAQELGGTLSVRSEGVGCGTTFTLELPVKPTKA